MSRYDPIKHYLIDQPARGQHEISLSFNKVEAILGFSLCDSAYKHPAWWANDRTHSQAKAWLDAGWRVVQVGIKSQMVHFEMQSSVSKAGNGKHHNSYMRGSENIEKGVTKEDILIVVSCTERKIWKEDPSRPVYVPAIDAYRGTSVTWLRNKVPEGRGFHCVILSAKYGFIEPEHPIAYYNVTFSKPNTGPISDISLKNQVCCQRRRFGTQKRRLCDFKYIFVKTGNRDKGRNKASYLKKVKTAFADTDARDNVRKLDNNLWHLMRLSEN